MNIRAIIMGSIGVVGTVAIIVSLVYGVGTGGAKLSPLAMIQKGTAPAASPPPSSPSSYPPAAGTVQGAGGSSSGNSSSNSNSKGPPATSATTTTTAVSSSNTASAAAATVTIVKGASTMKAGEKAFQPDAVQVKAGGTVTWKNEDTAAHTVTSGAGPSDPQSGKVFDSSMISPGKAFEHRFASGAGTYEYYCAMHPTMVGRVVVVV